MRKRTRFLLVATIICLMPMALLFIADGPASLGFLPMPLLMLWMLIGE